VLYVNREGVPIPPARWKELSADAAYFTVRQYDNAVVQVTLKWVGRVPDPDNTFPDYWPVFMILVKNYRADGTLAVDPADSDKTFPDETAAIKGYEEFLTRWTASSVDAEGKFTEEDNLLTPPPPPDPNVPQSVSTDLEEGAW
jgi:hypothetical protein